MLEENPINQNYTTKVSARLAENLPKGNYINRAFSNMTNQMRTPYITIPFMAKKAEAGKKGGRNRSGLVKSGQSSPINIPGKM